MREKDINRNSGTETEPPLAQTFKGASHTLNHNTPSRSSKTFHQNLLQVLFVFAKNEAQPLLENVKSSKRAALDM